MIPRCLDTLSDYEFLGRKKRVGKMDIHDAAVEAVEESPDHGCLSGAHLTGQENETHSFQDAVFQQGKGFLVAFAHVEKAGGWRQIERLFS